MSAGGSPTTRWGSISGAWSPDGEEICWWQDETGDESGRWYAQPFEGGDTRLLFPELEPGWNEGIAWVPGMLAASISRHDGFAVYVSEDGGAIVKEVARSTEHMRVAGSSGGYNRGRALRGRDAPLPATRRTR